MGKKMKDALENLCNVAQKLGCPYAVDYYDGHTDVFCVYGITRIEGAMYADNSAQAHIAYAELHYVEPYSRDYSEKLEDIKDLLLAEGFTEPVILIENDANKRIILKFSCEITV